MKHKLLKGFAALAAAVLAMVLMAVPAFAAESGTWGSCLWEITDDGALTVYPGVGEDITDDQSPWSDIDFPQVTSVVFVKDGEDMVVAPADSSHLFYNLVEARTFDLSGLDTSNVTDMNGMFRYCRSLESLDLSGFDTSNVTDMRNMFYSCYKLKDLDLSGFDTTNLSLMSYMFVNCRSLVTLDLSSFNTAQATKMLRVFEGCVSLTTVFVGDEWVAITNKSDSKYMFLNCESIIGANGTTFDSKNIIGTYAHVDAAGNPGYFTHISSLSEPGILTAEIADVPDQAYTGEAIEPELSISVGGTELVEGVDYRVVRYKDNIYPGTAAVYVVGLGDYAATGIATVTFQILVPEGYFGIGLWGDAYWEITDDGALTVYPGTGSPTRIELGGDFYYESPWIAYADEVTSVAFVANGDEKVIAPDESSRLFMGFDKLVSVDVSGLDTSASSNLAYLFVGCTSLKTLNLAGLNTASAINMTGIFEGCSNLMFIYVDDAWFADSEEWPAAYGEMFLGCYALTGGNGTAYDPDITNNEYARIDTPETPGYLSDASLLTQPGIAAADVSTVDELEYTGEALEPEIVVTLGETVLVEGQDYTVTYRDNVFTGTAIAYVVGAGAYEGTGMNGTTFQIVPPEPYVAIGAWGTCVWTLDNDGVLMIYPGTGADTYYYSWWFDYAELVREVVFVQEGDAKVVAPEFVDYLFENFINLEAVDACGLDTSATLSMHGMFDGCESLTTIDLSAWDTSQVTSMIRMFAACESLQTIYVGDGWSMASVDIERHGADRMFLGCYSLVGGNGTVYDEEFADWQYAHIDEEGNPGYFTAVGEEPVVKTGWQNENGGWYYYNADGTLLKDAFVPVAGKYYYVGKDGKLVTGGWIQYGGAAYYIDSDWSLALNRWVGVGGAFYYFDETAQLVANAWKQIGGKSYYFDENAQLALNTFKQFGGKFYYFDETAQLVANAWKQIGGKSYYFDENAQLALNEWKLIGGKYYCFGADAQPVTDKWFGSGDSWYYLKTDGTLAVNEWVDYYGYACHFNKNAVCDNVIEPAA